MGENFIIIAQQVLVLFILIAVGFICGKKKIITDFSARHMTDIVLYVVTPCVMISAFQREFSFELLSGLIICVACSALIFAVSILICNLIFHDKDESRKAVIRFATIYSNCAFMSLPLQKAILGDDGWFYGSIFVAVFNIFVWTHGLVSMSGDKKQLSFKKLVLNPGLIGVLLAIILFITGFKLPYIISQPVEYLAVLNTPLPMLIIGFYLSQADFKKAFTDKGVYFSSAVRLIALPMITAVVMSLCRVTPIITMACVAPTAATTTMFATKFNKDVELSVSIVAATTVFSLATMPLVVMLTGMMSGFSS